MCTSLLSYRISLQFFCFFFIFRIVSLQNPKTCEKLRPVENVEISCTQSINSNIENDCGDEQPIGTVAKYKCKPFYIPFEGISSRASINNNGIKCGPNGKWKDLVSLSTFRCVEDCGKRLVNPKPLVVHGVATNSTLWPWHAAIFIKHSRTGKYSYICGGTIIRNGVILTAAHCITKIGTIGETEDKELYKVVVGTISSNFTKNSAKDGAQIFDVQNIYVSSNFDPKKDYQADIAILHLSGRITFNDYAIPICLPNDYAVDLNALKPGRLGDVVGFGVDESGTPSPILKHGKLQITSHNECFNRLKQTLSESQFCAGGGQEGNFVTVCNGDSGGGLFYPADSLGKYYIHGIVSTGGIHDGKVCNNYGVFTRVFQFIFWIRDTLEQINGDIIRELSTNSKFPFIQRGLSSKVGDTSRSRFLGIPREWDNRIETIELTNVDFDPKVLLDSLEYSKSLTSLNLTRVYLFTPFNGRVRLPYLKTFVLNELREDFTNFRADILGIRFPFDITRTYLKSLLFFDKDYEEQAQEASSTINSWAIENITRLGTDIELTVDIFKLITVNRQQGKLALSNIPFSDQIIAGTLKDTAFNFTNFAISRCVLGLQQQIFWQAPLKSIIINEVRRYKGTTTDSSTLNKFIHLEELRFSSTNPFFEDSSTYELNQNLYLEDLSRKTLKYLALDHGILNYTRKQYFKEDFEREPYYFRGIETFSCFQCELDENVLKNFNSIFRNSKQIAVAYRDNLNITLWLKMERLEKLYLKSFDSYGYKTLKNFHGLEYLINNTNKSIIDKSDGAIILTREENGDWKLNLMTLIEWETLNYYELGRNNFWTSTEDYATETRLTSYEQDAYKTGHYKFNGTSLVHDSSSSSKKLEQFKFIPVLVQERLRTIEINNANVIPDDLLNSLKYTEKLESLVLNQVSLLGLFEDTIKTLPNLKKYKLDRLVSSVLGIDYIERVDEKLFSSMIPFTEPISPPFVYVNYATSDLFLKSNIEIMDISYDDCIMLLVNKTDGTFISAVKPALLQNFATSHQQFLKKPIKKLAIRNNRLSNLEATFPKTLTHLNLQEVYIKSGTKLGLTLEQLNLLQDLRLVDIKVESDTTTSSEVTNVGLDLNWLIGMTKSIEFLEFNSISIQAPTMMTISTPPIEFHNLKMVIFDKCKFDKFVIKHFSKIFRTKQLAILYSTLDLIPEEIRSQEQILLQFLENPNEVSTEWIYTNIYNYDYEYATILRTNVSNILEKKLREASVPNDVSPIILKKVKGKWIWEDVDNLNEIDYYLPKKKWTKGSNFGKNQHCQGKVHEYFDLTVRSKIREQKFGVQSGINEQPTYDYPALDDYKELLLNETQPKSNHTGEITLNSQKTTAGPSISNSVNNATKSSKQPASSSTPTSIRRRNKTTQSTTSKNKQLSNSEQRSSYLKEALTRLSGWVSRTFNRA